MTASIGPVLERKVTLTMTLTQAKALESVLASQKRGTTYEVYSALTNLLRGIA